jgi:RHS repeat-associated protein
MRRAEFLIATCLVMSFVLIGAITPAQATPVITSLSNSSLPIGGELSINGTGFGTIQGSSTVTINGQTVPVAQFPWGQGIELWGDTGIVLYVPIGTTTGSVVVTVGGVHSNAKTLTIVPPPVITSVTPSSGPVGTSITIKGSHFYYGGPPYGTTVNFYPTGSMPSLCGPSLWQTSTASSVTLQVPPGAVTGKLSIANEDNESAPVNFTVTGTLAPVADPGPDQAVSVGSTVTLNGTASYDLNGLPLTYQWSFSNIPAGSGAVLSNPTSPTPTFVADVAGPYVAQLTVNNGSFSSLTNDPPLVVTIWATPYSLQDVIPNAGPDQTVQVGSTVQLDASGTTQLAGGQMWEYSWSLWYRPNNTSQWNYSATSALSDPYALNPTFVASQPGTYFAQLNLGWYGGVEGDSQFLWYTPYFALVKISTVNSQPVANAGSAQNIQGPQTVQLDGTGSTDVDGNALTYSWAILSKPAGSTATLSSPTSPRPTFYADVVGPYVVQLIVNDGTVKSLPTCSWTTASRTATVLITNSALTPLANPGPAQTVPVGGMATLNGANSVDFDGRPLTYSWVMLHEPMGSTASLSLSTSQNPYFTADVAGKYVVQLVVNDGTTNSTPQTVMISTDNSRPVADAGDHQTVAIGSTVHLSGAESNDADGNALTYRWAILYQPSGANAVLSSATTVDPTFVASQAGLYVVQLIVNDGQLDSPPVTTWIKAAVNQAPVVSAGPNQAITLPTNRVTLLGSATDDGLPNNTLAISWTQVSGPASAIFSSPNTAVTDAFFSVAGTYVLQITANDSQLNSSATTTVTVNPGAIKVTLTPIVAGPDVVGISQMLTASVTQAGAALSGASVQFTVTGPNATTGSSTTDTTGTAKFTYTGANSGNDTVQASYAGTTSNSSTVSWLVPTQTVSTSTVYGRFFASDGSGGFDTQPTATPVFSLFFPTINFNPPAGTIPGNNSGVGVDTRPFTDVVTDISGNFSGTIVAQGNRLQAGVGSLGTFQAVFTSALTVPSAGNVTFNFYTDDGFILGIGGGATRVSGPMVGVPASGLTPFTNLTVVGAYNVPTAPVGSTIVVNFPAPGTYDYEVDYSECCGGQLVLTMATGQNNTGVPPTGSLTLTPINPSSLAAGQSQTFTTAVTDASGAALQNATVDLVVSGANQRQLSATTDATGHITFQYTGTNAGTDTVQASAVISGMGAYSNAVNMTWSVPSGGGCGTFAPQGWIGSPTIGTVIQGQVPITVASGVNLTSGTLTYWPTSNPTAITTLNSNTVGSGTIGTFDATVLASGGYTIQLNATANGSCQVSQITVTVVGESKPGRMTSTVTEFKVPIAGIPITISRTYDSLERNLNEDFGFGWKLGTTVGLSVDAKLNVTFNFNGQRETFYFAPQPQSFWFAWLQVPQYVPQPGLHGTLISDGCPSVINVQGTWQCFGPGLYQPTVYAYTDPIGRTYTVSASGQLQSIKDLNGNVLTVTQSGITSSVNGVVIPFVRDGSGRITQITDLNGNNYTYIYDTSGNLQSVSYPGLTTSETYTYFTDHSLKSETDPRGNTSSATYYTDPADAGRLQSITDTMQNTWSYSYNLSTNTTTTTNPPDGNGNVGTVVRTDDSFGKPLSITDPLNQTTTYQYDAHENLIKMIDPLQNPATLYTYDANGFQTSVQDPLGHTSTKVYNQYGGVTSATDAANTNTQTTTYDSNFNPAQVTDLLNGSGSPVSASSFDSLGNLLTSTDANGKTTQFAHDSRGNLIKVTDPLNEMTQYAYDAMDRLSSKTDPLGNTTLYLYDALGHVKDQIDTLGHTTEFTYDDNGNKLSETDANGHATNYQYDNMNRVKKITYPDQTTKQYTYDFRGNKLTEVDQSGRTTKYVYDLAGQLKSVTYAYGTPDAGTVQYIYDADGRQKTITDELGNATTNNYDAAGRLTSVQDALTKVTTYGYDFDNRRTSVQDANQNTTTDAYDARGRMKTVTYPIVPPATQPTTTQYTYDGMGRVLTSTDQAGKVTTKTYDGVGHLSTVKDALNNLTQYAYDLDGNLLNLTDAAGRVTSYQYDGLNRRAIRTLPLGMLESYTYDPAGNLATKTDFNGKATTNKYDVLNRLLSKTPQTGTAISFTYTPTGQRLTMTDASGTTNYTSYDNRDRLKTKVIPEGTLNYTYDAHGNLWTIASSNTNGASMTYTYDVLNRLASAKDNRVAAQGGPSTPTTYSYDPAGNLTGYALSNSLQTGNVFDPLNRLTQTCVATASPACSAGTKLASYAYTLGNAGNRTAVAELNGRNVGYGYDNDYRLSSEAITGDPAGNNGTVTYNTYDNVGNRTLVTSTLNAVPGGSFSYDANDRLTTDTYDNNGNTISFAGISNSYDFENRMTAHGAVIIVYDGDGNRVSETAGGTATKYLVDDHNPTGLPQVLDEIVSGSVTRTYAYGLQRTSENQLISGTWTPSFYGYDGHGNVRFLTNSAGTITDSYTYDAFGMQIAHTGTTPNVFQYSGEWLDSNVGLYYLRARYLNQATGRFWTRDPVEGKKCCGLSWNPYIYVKQNPVNEIDPTGKEAIIEYLRLSGASEETIFEWRVTEKVVEFETCFEGRMLELLALEMYAGEDPELLIEELTPEVTEYCQAWVLGAM